MLHLELTQIYETPTVSLICHRLTIANHYTLYAAMHHKKDSTNSKIRPSELQTD